MRWPAAMHYFETVEKDPSVPVRSRRELMLEGTRRHLNAGDKTVVERNLTWLNIRAQLCRVFRYCPHVYSTARKRHRAAGGEELRQYSARDGQDQVVADIAGAAFASAGERCMVLPVAVP